MIIERLRKKYHKNIFEQLLSVDDSDVPSNADKSSKISVALAKGIVEQIALNTNNIKRSGQTSGKSFENLTASFLEETFKELRHLRGGEFDFFIGRSIDSFEQYEHLALLEKTLLTNRELRATLGDYIIKPDIVIGRRPVADSEINKNKTIISGDQNATLTPLRKANTEKLTLHASISCKWTIRSDRSQNARTEGLNLIRNRKGQTPHIVIVTAEPYPQRIASIALGTGDIDCVYHFALRELIKASEKLNNEAITDIIETLVVGKRLRDISDLPFDLAI
ncbi:MAG: NgoMIV family type II restriction endonuclease [Candidatus Marinimicrobia bacterium]|nr:NgoMIV family type II restriction endonuclease [Candidatus Neomarinimicrobiota bacterium]